jgi:hypothetical protein
LIVPGETNHSEMTDLEARADCIRVIVEGHRGKVIDRVGNVMTFEMPADVSVGLNAFWEMSGLVAVLVGQTRHGARLTYTIDLGVDKRRRKR